MYTMDKPLGSNTTQGTFALSQNIQSLQRDTRAKKKSLLLPLYAAKVSAGFPSPADDYLEQSLDLNTHLIERPAATYFVTVSGDSMVDAGIRSGDTLIVDRSLEPVPGKIVIAAINGELTVKRLAKNGERLQLLPAHSHYPPINITEEHDLVIWGVVTYIIHRAD